MANTEMVNDWNRGQALTAQPRYYTPGQLQTQYQVSTEPMDMLVVLHHDSEPTAYGQHRVDVIVNSGSTVVPAAQSNGHIVNRYSESTGVTDHTALYTDTQLAALYRASDGNAGQIHGRPSGPPGADVFSVRGKLRADEYGQLMIDTEAGLEPGPAVSGRTLHDVQVGMNTRRAIEASAEKARTAPTWQPTNSQAGIAAMAGPRNSYASVPAPGQPGSRFNPVVRERNPQPQAAPEAGQMIESVPDFGAEQATGEPVAKKRQLRMPTAEEISAAGRIGRKAVTGAGVGTRVGAALPHPVAKVAATAVGAVIGAGQGVVGEADRVVAKREKAEAKAEADAAKQEAGFGSNDLLGRMAGVIKQPGQGQPAPVEQVQPTLADTHNYLFDDSAEVDDGYDGYGR